MNQKKVVLITGASKGLGLLTAQEFLKAGYIVYGTSRFSDNNKDTENINMLVLDVCSNESCDAAVESIIKEHGQIDVLINNAGFGVSGPVEYTDEKDMLAQFDVIFFGAVRMVKSILPFMRVKKGGTIINISSVAAEIPLPFQSMYSSGKAALSNFSQSLNIECRCYGIISVCLEFGDMKTSFTAYRRKVNECEPYTERYLKSLAKMEKSEQSSPLPLKAAKLIVKTAKKKKPKPLVVCGIQYKFVVILRRFLPIRLSDFLICKILM